MKKRLAALMSCVLLLSSCGMIDKFLKKDTPAPSVENAVAAELESPPAETKRRYNVAVILPDTSIRRWERSAKEIVANLEAMDYGYEVFYENAGRQVDSINMAVAQRMNCIIIAAADSYSADIREELEKAKNAGISVIAYDRLVMDTESVDCYVAFDPYLSGRMCAEYLLGKMDLGSGSCNIEILTPETTDNSGKYFYHGAMDVFLPYIHKGAVNVPSGRVEYSQTSLDGAPEAAGRTMEAILSDYYPAGRRLDAVLTTDDSAALAVIETLESYGYGNGGAFPLVAGGGCYIENAVKITEGKQAVSLFRDERVIAKLIVETADFLTHNIYPGNADRTTFDNGKKIVPAVLEPPIAIDSENVKELLIGGDYYSYTEMNPESSN